MPFAAITLLIFFKRPTGCAKIIAGTKFICAALSNSPIIAAGIAIIAAFAKAMAGRSAIA